MASIKVEHSIDKPVVISYKRGSGKWKKLCVLTDVETVRRVSKYVILVSGSNRPMLYNLKNGEAARVTQDSRIGRKYLV